jgi:hypothetical protein
MEDNQDMYSMCLSSCMWARTKITCHQCVIMQGLREILERYMEDDQDMYSMYLSRCSWT